MDKTVSLKENHRFRALYAKGKHAAAKTVAVYVLKNREKTSNKLGITVSKKLGHAVQRNLVRRRIREIYRLHETELRTGVDIVVVARTAAVDATYGELQRDLLYAFRKLGLNEERQDG